MTDRYDPNQNPPGWTDPYADLNDLSGDEPLPPMEPPTTPPAQPPGSPLLTGLIIALLLIALSVAVFQLLSRDENAGAGDTTTTTVEGETTTTSLGDTTTTTEGTTSTTVPSDPYEPVGDPIPVDRLKLITNGVQVNDNDIPNIVFGQDADTAIGRFVASFGEPTEDTGFQVSTGQFGVCAGDLERIVYFGPFASIVTKPGGQEQFNGYRFDLEFGDLTNPAAGMETLSGLKLGDPVSTLEDIYSGEEVSFSTDTSLGEIFQVHGSTSGALLLWGPVEGSEPSDRILGIYAPDVCSR